MEEMSNEQEGKDAAERAGNSSSASYAGAVKTSNQKLVVTRKVSEGDGTMEISDLREVQRAVTRRILNSSPDFLVQIERTFLLEGKVLLICKDEKTLDWAKSVVEAIAPSLADHQGYVARGPKDRPPEKTFGIWIPEEEGLSIIDVLALVDRCNAEVHRRDMEFKYKAKGSGGSIYVVAVREPSLTGLKNLEYAPYAGYRRVHFQTRNVTKKTPDPETPK